MHAFLGENTAVGDTFIVGKRYNKEIGNNKDHSLLCYLFLRTKPTFGSAPGLPASLPETQQVFSISLRPMNDKVHRQQIRNNFKHCRNINRTLTASWVIFFKKEYTAQQRHPILKIPTQNSCKRQNPLPKSLPLSIH